MGSPLCAHESTDTIQNQAGEAIAWVCNRCLQRGPIRPPPPREIRECLWCGDDYAVIPAWWLHQRFCTKQCYIDDLEDRRESHRPLAKRTSQRGRPMTEVRPCT